MNNVEIKERLKRTSSMMEEFNKLGKNLEFEGLLDSSARTSVLEKYITLVKKLSDGIVADENVWKSFRETVTDEEGVDISRLGISVERAKYLSGIAEEQAAQNRRADELNKLAEAMRNRNINVTVASTEGATKSCKTQECFSTIAEVEQLLEETRTDAEFAKFVEFNKPKTIDPFDPLELEKR